MQSIAQYKLQNAHDRRADEMREIAYARLVRRPPHPIRRSVGRSIIGIGLRLAGEARTRPVPAT
jgi:hypothetical protein